MSYSLDGLTEATFTIPHGNEMEKEGILNTLAQSIRGNNTCQRLDLTGNEIGNKGLEILADAIRLNSTLIVCDACASVDT